LTAGLSTVAAMKTPLIYGCGITFAAAVVTLALHLTGFSTNPEKLIVTMIVALPTMIAIAVVGIVLGTRKERAEKGAAGFSYGAAFKTGFLIALVASITGALFNLIYYTLLFPEFAEVSIEWTRSLLTRMGTPEADIERMIEETRAKSTVTRQVISGFIFSLVFNTIISLITAAIMKRAPADQPGELPPTIG
jgi:hypothetical protein